MATYTSTLKALAAPRRAVPIALVIASVVGVELYYGGPALVPLCMSVAFVLLARTPTAASRFPSSSQRRSP